MGSTKSNFFQDLKEQNLRIELMSAQVETEKKKAAFYEKVGHGMDAGTTTIEITSPSFGDFHVPM